MPLVARITLSITAILGLCVAGGTLLVHQVVADKFESVETDLVLRNRAVVSQSLQNELEFLQFTVTDWGHWDDLHDYAAGRNPAFATAELGDRGVQRLNLDALLVIDAAGKVLHADFSRGIRAEPGVDLSGLAGSLVAGIRGQNAPDEFPGQRLSGFVNTPVGVLALATQPIYRTAGADSSTGYLVMARRVDPRRLTSELSVLPAEVFLYSGRKITPELHELAISLARKEQTGRLVVQGDRMADYQLFRDLNGKPAFLLESRMDRSLAAAGRETTAFIAAINLAAMALVLIALVSVLRQLVVQPVTTLKNYMQNLRDGDVDAPVPGVQQGDEIGVLAQEFDALTRARRADAAAMARLAAAVEHAGDSIAVLDRTGHIVYVNPQYERQRGCTAAEVVGRGPSRGRSPDPVYSQLWSAVEQGQEWHGLLESERKNGTRILEDVTVTPIRGRAGEVTGYVAVMRDVTASEDAESELRKLAAAVENSADAMVVLNGQGRIEYCNPAYERQRRLPLSQLYGKHPSEIGRGLDPLSYYQEIWQAVLSGASWSGEINTERLDGTRLVEEVVLSPIRNPSGEVTHYVAVMHDATARRQLEADLAQARRLEAIGQLAAGVAHEINTPIQYVGDNIRFLQECFRTVAGLVDALTRIAEERAGNGTAAAVASALEGAEVAYLKEEVPKAIGQSLEGVERVAEIVRSMKELAHPARDLVAVDLNRVVASAITVAGPEWKAVAELVTQLDPALPPVPCLPGAINQVVVNMLVNAAQAISEAKAAGGNAAVITVSTRCEDGWAEIEVRDTGTGMSAEVQERVFDPFFTTKPVGKGTGQGLAIAHAVVKKHRGEIIVSSRPGAGTIFVVRLPLEPAMPDALAGAA